MFSGSKGVPGVWKARTGKKGVETMMTELDKRKEFAICYVDEFRDEEVRMAETTSFCPSEKSIYCSRDLSAAGRHLVRSAASCDLVTSRAVKLFFLNRFFGLKNFKTLKSPI